MANGNVVSGGSGYQQYRWYSTLNVSRTSNSATSATYKVTVGYYTQYAIQSYANAKLSGSASGSWSGQMYSTSQSGRSVTVISKTVTVSKGSSSKTLSFSAQVQVTGGYGNGTSRASASVTVPAIDYDAPNAPSACSASRVTDKQSKVTWTNGGTSTTKPRSSTKVERQTDSGKWTQIASVGSSTRNYTDNGISANHRYRYRVRAYGSGGYSDYSTSGYIYTTPKAPSSVSLVKLSDTQVQVSISGTAAWADGYELQRSVDSGSWAAAATVTSWPYTDVPGGGYVKYRVRAKRGTLASAWTESAEIATIAPPLAPAVTLDPTVSVLPTGTVVTVRWVPNHPDASEQTQAQVEYTVGGAEAQTAAVSGSATSYRLPEIATASAGTVTVRVRTHGLDDEWGAWSSPVQVNVAVPPSVSITNPAIDGDVVDVLPLELAWEVEDSTGVSSQTLSLYEDGELVRTAQLAAGARSYVLDAATYRLDNLTSYAVEITVTGGSSLAVTKRREFETDYLEPAYPDPVTGSDYSNMSVSLEMRAGEGDGTEPATSYYTVERQDEGSRWLVADNLAEGEECIDVLPPLNTEVLYLVTAHAESGTTATSNVTVIVDSGGQEAFNFGAAAETCLLLGYNATGSESIEHSGEEFHFALGPDNAPLPTFYPDGDLDVSGSHDYEVYGREQYEAVRAAVRRRENSVCWFRDAFGHRARVKADWDLSYDAEDYQLWGVSADLTEVVWEDPLS